MRHKWDTNEFATAQGGVINLNSVSTMLLDASVSGDDMVKITIKTVFSQSHRPLEACNGLGMMSYEGKTPLTIVQGNLSGARYQDEILDVIVRPHFQQFQAERPIFMDDNTCPHRARLVDAYTVRHNIDSLQWTSMSPDLNPIEHVWNAIQKAVNARQPPVTTLQELDMALHQEWNQMPQQTCRNIVQSTSRQCQAVPRARGGHTYYQEPIWVPATTDAPVTLQWTFWWKLPWAKWYFVMQPLCYHICFHLRISFSCRHRNEFKLFFALQNGHFFMFCFICFIAEQTIHNSYVLVHFVLPEYCCCCHVNKFFEGEQIQSVIISQNVGTLKIANMQNFCSCVYIFRLRFHWSLFPMVQLIIFQHWFR